MFNPPRHKLLVLNALASMAMGVRAFFTPASALRATPSQQSRKGTGMTMANQKRQARKTRNVRRNRVSGRGAR